VYDEVRNRPVSLISRVHRAPAQMTGQIGVVPLPNASYAMRPEKQIKAA
jgi:hypothetical protein